MNYQQSELKNALSSAYVLGTLSNKARVRYKRLLMQDETLQHNVWQWEQRLNQMALALPVQQPDQRVWNNIEKRLDFDKFDTRGKSQWWRTLLSPGWLLMNVLLIIVALLLWQAINKNTDETLVQRIAVVQNDQAQALWSIALNDNGINVNTTDKLTQYSNNDYQLWMIVKEQSAPISLGLLPQDGGALLLVNNDFGQYQIQALAVSLEPIGGSPNGQPTKVLYTTELVSL